MIICLETATNLCSVALCDNEGVRALKESGESKSHASMLTVFIEEILKENGVKPGELEAIAVSRGPGSYTGLRIGVSAAKGIAYGASIPLIAIDTTLSMFHGIAEKRLKHRETDSDTIFCPMLDARRMEVYYALYNSEGKRIKDIAAEVITGESFTEFPSTQKILFFGDGSSKCRPFISRPDYCFDTDYRISAAHMHKPVYEAFNRKLFEDVAYFEPFYLKDFITTKQRKNILG
jgi:tRNA threonylcarbamoyladenosine biosynthesis protein TsaB